ncbi:hypothetical protein BsWGS_06371 [Bradybaena similaris]
MPGSRLNVHLQRHSPDVPWGFRVQGGRDLNQAITVQRVFSNSPAEGELQRGDVILSINNLDSSHLLQAEAQNLIKQPGGHLNLLVNRPPPGTSAGILSPTNVTQEQSPYQGSPSNPPSRPSNIQMTQPSFTISYNGPYQQQPQYKPPHQPLHVYASPGPNYQYPVERQRSSYSQPPSTPTPTTPVPPWASQQFAPKKVTKLSKLGGGGFDFGTVYATLPRGASTAYYSGRTQSQSSYDGPQEQEPERRATGPIPKVCRLRNLGGGGYDFGSSFGAATLPRHGGGRRLSQPVKMPSAAGFGYQPSTAGADRYGGGGAQFGSDYSYKGYGPSSAQRVQSNLDYAPTSRSSEIGASSQNYQPYEQSYQPQKVYTPTALLLEQQRLQEQQEDVRTARYKPAAKFGQSRQAPTSYSNFGTDYTRPAGQQSTAAWSPTHQIKPTQAPVQKHASTAYTPIAVQYSQQSATGPTATRPSPPGPSVVHVQTAAPSWRRQEEEDTGVPTWRSSLKTTGKKPWEAEENYAPEHPPASKPSPAAAAQSGDRDWSQSAVLRLLSQEDTRKSKQPPPPVAPKPQYSPVQASPQYQSSYYDEVAASDF